MLNYPTYLQNKEIKASVMGRPPCCGKIGVKKGPWTPEEDIILVSYIHENGPGNWRAVPSNTGLINDWSWFCLVGCKN